MGKVNQLWQDEQMKAIDIPMHDCGLKINVGRDGCWLHFTSESGLSASINVENMDKGGIIGRALQAWCEERYKQAADLAQDNGQFGVGA